MSIRLSILELLDTQIGQLLRGPVRIRLWVVDGQEHGLDAAQVGRAILLEAACDVGAGCVDAGKDVVGAAGTIDAATVGDVEDCAVDGQVERFLGIGAVKFG